MSRQRREREELIRLVVSPEGELLVDYRGKLPGRGAWVAPTRQAVEEVQRKSGLLQRSLRARPDTSGLLEKVQAANYRAVLDALTICQKAGALIGGKDGVRGAISSGRALAVILAGDASERLVEDLSRRVGVLPCVQVPLDCYGLGSTVGKGPRSALAVLASKPGRHLLRELRRYEGLR